MRKLESLQLLGARPSPNLRAAWNAEMQNGAIVFIGWTNESKFDANGELAFCRVLDKTHLSNKSQGGRRRIFDIENLLKSGRDAYLLLADGVPGEIKNGIRNELYRVSLQDFHEQVNAIPINRSSLLDWRLERRNEFDEDAETNIKISDLSETEKESLVMSRRGQGLFRQRVLMKEPRCRLTGIDDVLFLRASHIKPWADSDNRERLDGSNGLMLSPHVDHLFDLGFISFRQTGEILVADKALTVMSKWKLSEITTGSFSADQELYLAYHRERIFRASR